MWERLKVLVEVESWVKKIEVISSVVLRETRSGYLATIAADISLAGDYWRMSEVTDFGLSDLFQVPLREQRDLGVLLGLFRRARKTGWTTSRTAGAVFRAARETSRGVIRRGRTSHLFSHLAGVTHHKNSRLRRPRSRIVTPLGPIVCRHGLHEAVIPALRNVCDPVVRPRVTGTPSRLIL